MATKAYAYASKGGRPQATQLYLHTECRRQCSNSIRVCLVAECFALTTNAAALLPAMATGYNSARELTVHRDYDRTKTPYPRISYL